MLIILRVKVLPKYCVIHFFNLIHLLSTLVKPNEDSLLVIVRRERCICLYTSVNSSLALRRVMNDVMNCKLLI